MDDETKDRKDETILNFNVSLEYKGREISVYGRAADAKSAIAGIRELLAFYQEVADAQEG